MNWAKKMKTVFILQHSNLLPSGEQSVKFIGVYRTAEAAIAAAQRLAGQPGFSKHPQIIEPDTTDEEEGFYLDEYELDKDHWTEGCVTMVGDEEYRD